jgi:hypothetical protein
MLESNPRQVQQLGKGPSTQGEPLGVREFSVTQNVHTLSRICSGLSGTTTACPHGIQVKFTLFYLYSCTCDA